MFELCYYINVSSCFACKIIKKDHRIGGQNSKIGGQTSIILDLYHPYTRKQLLFIHLFILPHKCAGTTAILAGKTTSKVLRIVESHLIGYFCDIPVSPIVKQ